MIFDISKNKENVELGEFILEFIKKHKASSKSNILEIGCGNGRIGHLIGDGFQGYFGIDPNEEMIKLAKKNNPKQIYKTGSAEKIPFEESFDIVLFVFSWHFLRDFDRALLEVKRVLSEEGIIVIVEPTKDSIWSSPKLNFDSPDFNKDLYDLKIKDLYFAKEKLYQQKVFSIVGEKLGKRRNIWVLKCR